MSKNMTTLFDFLDSTLTTAAQEWNIFTTILVTGLAILFLGPLFFIEDPDVHPLLLARGSVPSPTRQSGESATYRCTEATHGSGLTTGLEITDADTPKYTKGRDGDLRDIWLEAVKGVDNGSNSKIWTAHGTNQATSTTLKELEKHIIAIGQWFKTAKVSRVAIVLPNSQEAFAVLFACSFYGITPVLIPHQSDSISLEKVLTQLKADCVAISAGVAIKSLSNSIRAILLVVEEANRELDFHTHEKSSALMGEYHNIVKSSQAISTLPARSEVEQIQPVVSVYVKADKSLQVVEYSQKNIVSAIAGQAAAIPRLHKIQKQDLVCPLDSLSDSYTLTIVLLALFSHASLALVNAAYDGAPYDLSHQGISPTIVIASGTTIKNAVTKLSATSKSIGIRLAQMYTTYLQQSQGRFPSANSLVQRLGPRLIFTSLSTTSPSRLSAVELQTLRVLTGARTVYSLTDPHVAGAVSQSNIFDYVVRADQAPDLGVPLSSVQIKLIEDSRSGRITDTSVKGKIEVAGPSVVGKTITLDFLGEITDRNTLREVRI